GVGVLLFPSAQSVESRLNAFREGLRDLGYTEGRNLVLESRFANGDYNQLPVLAGELARLKVDVFFVVGEPVLLAAKEKGENIPIVVVSCDPLEKLLGSLRRPGGNVRISRIRLSDWLPTREQPRRSVSKCRPLCSRWPTR